MSRFVASVVLLAASASLAASPPAEEVNALALLAGARALGVSGQPTDEGSGLVDGFADAQAQWEPSRSDFQNGPASVTFELAEPFDLTRAVVTNSFSEEGYPGISTKRLRLEAADKRSGPWTVLAEPKLKQGTRPQPVAIAATKGTRYVRVTLLENYGDPDWWSLAELEVFGRRTTPRVVDFNGLWDTSYGQMKLVQTGQRVVGCYGGHEDKSTEVVEGTVEGPIFFGIWTEYGGGDEVGGRGPMAFALTKEGHLSGVWGSDPSGRDRTGRWDGTPLKKKSAIVCAPPEKTLARDLEETGRVALRGILFDTGQDVIRPESESVLQALAAAMRETEARYLIEGHTDDRGTPASNQALSDKRAASVKGWLVQAGIEAGRLATKGFGQTRPTLANDSEAGRAANRRVEVAVER